jgi:hypothetical protein
LVSCKDKTPPSKYGCIKSNYDEPPNQVMEFGFENNSTFSTLFNIDINDSIPVSGPIDTLIYYFKNNMRVYVDYVLLTRKVGDSNSRYFISTGSVLYKSYSENIKQFYIDWPNGQKDSLYVDYTQDDSRDNPCCCQYPLHSLRLNDKSYLRKDDYSKNGIYIFER